MPPEHVFDKRLLMYIHIYNLKCCFEFKCQQMCVKTAELLRIIFLLRWVFDDSGKFMGKKRLYLTVRVPAIILTCPITTMTLVVVLWRQERLRSYGIHANS